MSGDNPDSTYFVDGGVLDNKPFGWAIDTIIESRPAEAEVDRKLLYIEPDPGGRALREGGVSPDTLHAAVGALTTIPRSEPILDDLLVVQGRNEQVGRIRDVIETNFDRVAALVRPIVQPAVLAATPPDQWPWGKWNTDVYNAALSEAGTTYSTYVRLKISNVVDGLATSVSALCNYPKESNHAQLVRAVVRAWACNHGLYGAHAATPPPDPCAAEDEHQEAEPYRPSEEQVSFLRAFDLGFVRRRTRFVIAAFNWWYRCAGREGFPERSELDEGKTILYETIADIDHLALLRLTADSPAEETAEAESLRKRVVEAFGEETITAWFRHGDSTNGEAFLQAEKGARPSSTRSSRPCRRSSAGSSHASGHGCSRDSRRSRSTGTCGGRRTSSSATSASRSGTCCSTRSSRSPSSAKATQSRSSASARKSPRSCPRRTGCPSRESSWATSMPSSAARHARTTTYAAASTPPSS